MENIFKAALGIESPWYVESIDFDAQSKRLDIHLKFKRGTHFEVVDSQGELHSYRVRDTVDKTWRHLNFFEHECYLHANVPRVTTHEGKVASVEVPWAGKMKGFTLLFESLLLQLCKHMPVSQVEKLTNVSDDKLWALLDWYVESARSEIDCTDLSVVGMDETSLCRGHDYITLFVDLEQTKTLHVAQGKDSQTVKEFAAFLVQAKASPQQITDVSCDMSPAFIKGVNENLPKAQITFDKFHIVKIINEAVDKVRREEAKTNPLLKNSRYIVLKNDKNLTAKQREKKQELQLECLNLKTMQALGMRETFQQIYHAKTQENFVQLLQKWIDWVGTCGLTAMEKAAQCVKNHWDGIVAWKKSQINNGILEGLNSIIQAAKRKARGYKAKHFATMTYLLTGKLNFSAINPHYKHT